MNELNGIVVVNKEKDFTSHDVVNVMRKILGTKKIGHTGTLDPNAEGVLPICVGKSTKVSDMLTVSDKEYVAELKLGITTDTYDIWGQIAEEKEVDVSDELLANVLEGFVGEIEQIPPMYSAIKIGGKKLCDLARKGIEIERKPRKINIYELELLSFDGINAKIRVFCSKGTYIRSLCNDIGTRLGCGATMTSLVRTKSSVFDISQAQTLAQIKDKVNQTGAGSVLWCPDCVFGEYEKIAVSDIVKARLLNGAVSRSNSPVGTYRTYDSDGRFIGIAEVFCSEKGNAIKIVKGFM